MFRKPFDQQLGHRRFSRSADRQVPDTDYGNIELLAPKNLQIEQFMPDMDDHSVQPRQRDGDQRR